MKSKSEDKILLFEDFTGEKLDPSKWIAFKKQWGGNNGGVDPSLVSVHDGKLWLEAHGNNYAGIKRVGAAIKTVKKFSNASFEVSAKILPQLGACSAFWTFYWQEAPDPINHEIDIELPTAISDSDNNIDFRFIRMNSWVTEKIYTETRNDIGYSLNDNAFHTYRFDWYNGMKVEFFIDNKKIQTITTNVPIIPGELTIGVWFPANNVDGSGWSGVANFDIDYMVVDWVKIKKLSL